MVRVRFVSVANRREGDISLTVDGAFEVVFVTGDIGLLPVAEGHLEHANGIGARVTGEAVFLVGGNPDLVAGTVRANGSSHLDDGTVVEDDPQFGATGVRLQAQALARQHGHETDRAIAIVCVLFERAPGTLDKSDGWLFCRNSFGNVVDHKLLFVDWVGNELFVAATLPCFRVVAAR